MSSSEKSIYRPFGVGVFLTYLYAVRGWIKVVQIDMVTVRTIIKGLCRGFDGMASNHDLMDILIQDLSFLKW
jgi:hypothetical protein